MITVLRNRYVPSWPRHADGERVDVVPLGDALDAIYTTDAHFAQYASPNGRRLSREAVGQVEIVLNVIAFDIDCPTTHGTAEPAPTEWREEMQRRAYALHQAHPQPLYYETRGGARIVYRLPQPTSIATLEDARGWSTDYAVVLAYLERVFGIVADPACGDWTRLFRLPYATREQSPEYERWILLGSLDRIGALHVTPSADDLATASRRCKAFHTRRDLDFAPVLDGGHGVLFHVLAARGDVIREHTGGAYVVRCPREHTHSCGHTGDTSTLLYPPGVGCEVGAIHCMHAHCASMTTSDWIRLFSAGELEAARSAAGLVRAA